jgi:hypothetical protein
MVLLFLGCIGCSCHRNAKGDFGIFCKKQDAKNVKVIIMGYKVLISGDIEGTEVISLEDFIS